MPILCFLLANMSNPGLERVWGEKEKARDRKKEEGGRGLGNGGESAPLEELSCLLEP